MTRKKIFITKKIQNNIAKDRIIQLFLMAEKMAFLGDLNLANRYVDIARKISMRFKVKIPKEFKRRFCKNCYSYLLPGSNCRIRINQGKLIIYCYNCEKYTRFIFKNNEQSSARLK